MRQILVIVIAWFIGRAVAKAGGLKNASRGLRWFIWGWWFLVGLIAVLIAGWQNPDFLVGFSGSPNVAYALGNLTGSVVLILLVYSLAKWFTARQIKRAAQKDSEVKS